MVLENAWQGHLLHRPALFLPLIFFSSMFPQCCVLPSLPWFLESGLMDEFLTSLFSHPSPLHISPLSPSLWYLSGSLTLVNDISLHHIVTRWLLHLQYHISFSGKKRRKEGEAKEHRWALFGKALTFCLERFLTPEFLLPFRSLDSLIPRNPKRPNEGFRQGFLGTCAVAPGNKSKFSCCLMKGECKLVP